MFRSRLILFLIILISLQSCISVKKMVYLQDKSQDKPHQYEQNKTFSTASLDYKIEKEDVLFIEVLYQSIGNETNLDKSTLGERESRLAVNQHPYTSGYQVNESGKILIETLGEFEVIGKTIDEIRSMLIERANSYYLSPTVKIYLMNAYVTVLGEVNTPGRFQIFDEMNVLEAIGIAGDLGEFADRESIKILRPTNDDYEIYHIDLTNEVIVDSEKFRVKPGDVILVKPQTRKKFAGRNIQWILSGLSVVVSIIAILSRSR